MNKRIRKKRYKKLFAAPIHHKCGRPRGNFYGCFLSSPRIIEDRDSRFCACGVIRMRHAEHRRELRAGFSVAMFLWRLAYHIRWEQAAMSASGNRYRIIYVPINMTSHPGWCAPRWQAKWSLMR